MNQVGTNITSPHIGTAENLDKHVTNRVHSNTQRDGIDQVESKELIRKKIHQRLFTQGEQRLQQILQSKVVSNGLITLVGGYAVLIFVIVALEELLDTTEYNKAASIIQWVELSILGIFVVEIVLGIYAWTLKIYYRDRWLILDSLLIALSIFFVIFDMATVDSNQNNVIKVIQAIFRFLRIFLLIRKAQNFKKIQIDGLQTPSERITKFLSDLKDLNDSIDVQLDLEYCIHKISNRQLYEFGQMADDDEQMTAWISQNKQGVNQTTAPRLSQIGTKQKHQMNIPKLKIPKKLLDILMKQHDDLYIDPFECDKVGTGEGLVHLLLFLFEYHNLFDVYQIKAKTLRGYATEIMLGYKDNPYHNRVHSFDVTQTTNCILNRCKLIDVCQLSEQDISCVFIAAAVHDYGHPGFTNSFLINSRSELSMKYNDQSVLEMFHASSAFHIAWNNEKVNIFDNLTSQQYKAIRESIICMVLSTDMAHHQQHLSFTTGRINSPDFEPKGKDKQKLLDLVVHAADISNPMKQFDIYKEWTYRVMNEFWAQGDKERELKLSISYLCDRFTTNMASAQFSFIDYVVKPTFSCLLSVLPELESYQKNLEKNKAKWAELEDYHKQQLSLLQAK